MGLEIHQITIKTPNPKCCPYCCLIASGDTVSHVGISTQLCELLPLYLLFSSPPPPPHLNKYRSLQSTQCVTGGGDRVVWRAYSGVLHSVFDQILKLLYKIALPPQTKTKKTEQGRGPQTEKHLPPSTFTGQFLRKAEL